MKERVLQKVFGAQYVVAFYAKAFNIATHSESADDIEVENYDDFDGMEKYDTTLLSVTDKVECKESLQNRIALVMNVKTFM